MSLLIKGMEMLPNGTYTMNVHVVNGKAIVRKLDKNGLGVYEMIEIPTPHGRLIDADKLAKEILRAWNLWEKKGEDCYLFADVLTPMLISQPTVIESEE